MEQEVYLSPHCHVPTDAVDSPAQNSLNIDIFISSERSGIDGKCRLQVGLTESRAQAADVGGAG